MKKNVLSLLLTVALLLMCLPLGAIQVAADTYGDYTYTVTDGEVTITGYKGSAKNLVIPATINGYPVTAIGNGAFESRSFVSVVIPEGVTTIGSASGVGAFESCSRLTSVTIPTSINYIGWATFSNCSGLASVYISDIAAWCNTTLVSTTSCPMYYGADLYINGVEATSIVIPDGITAIKGAAFYGCRNLVSVTVPEGVTSIGQYSFRDCTALMEVSLPEGLEEIKSYAFYNCTALPTITIPDTVATLGEYAFYNCDALTAVTIPGSVTGIEASAFYDCDALTSVTILEGPTSIGAYAFRSCDQLASVTLPQSVSSIGSYVFYDCRNLKNIYYTSDVAHWNRITKGSYYVGYHINGGNTHTSNHTLHYGKWYAEDIFCTEAGTRIFYCTTCDKDITEAVAATGHRVVDGVCAYCDRAVTVIESAHPYENSTDRSWSYTDPAACNLLVSFTNATVLENKWDIVYVYDSENTLVAQYAGTEAAGKTVTVPGKTVTLRLVTDNVNVRNGFVAEIVGDYVHPYADATCTTPKTCTICGYAEGDPLGHVWDIADCTVDRVCTVCGESEAGKEHTWMDATYDAPSTCSGCGQTEGDVVPHLVASYKPSFTTTLTVYQYGDRAEHILVLSGKGQAPLWNTTDLYATYAATIQSLVIEEGITTIGYGAYKNMPALESVTLPSTLTAINGEAFRGCTSLKTVNLPEGLTTIGYAAFMGSGLTEVVFPDSVVTMGKNVFQNCKQLESVTFGASKLAKKTLPARTFSGCTALKNVDFGTKLQLIDDYAFNQCGIENLYLPANIKSVDNAAFYKAAIKTIEIADGGATYLGWASFYGCTGLESVDLGDSLVTISTWVFTACDSLKEITIPNTVTSIGRRTFSWCNGLETVVLSDGMTEVKKELFYACQALKNVTLPTGLTDIGPKAFYKCKALTSLDIPEGVTVADTAFTASGIK